MDTSEALAKAAKELLEYGEYSTATNDLLAQNMLSAALEWYTRRPWSFQWSTGVIATTAETKEYDLPTGFDGLVREERLSRPGIDDILSVGVIPDASTNEMVRVRLDRGRSKIIFEQDPGTSTYILRHKVALTALTALSSWPESLAPALIALTKGYTLDNSEDTKERGAYFKSHGDRLFKQAWNNERRGHSLQEEREPRDIYGVPLHYSFNGSDNSLWGE